MSEIKAALTTEEWGRKHHKIQCYDSWDEDIVKAGVGEIAAGGGYLHLTSHQHGAFADFTAGADRHALAALCLHDQPFGFTREYVDTLRKVIREASVYEVGDDEKDDMRSIADRIEALLPPEAG